MGAKGRGNVNKAHTSGFHVACTARSGGVQTHLLVGCGTGATAAVRSLLLWDHLTKRGQLRASARGGVDCWSHSPGWASLDLTVMAACQAVGH